SQPASMVLHWLDALLLGGQAAWLSGSEKRDLEDALAAEQQGIKPVKNYREAFRSPKVIVLSLQYFCWSIGVYGFVLWLPTIL
ncbi:hypothetical protein ACV33X_34530, partial [Pseudomonas aeruginosa]